MSGSGGGAAAFVGDRSRQMVNGAIKAAWWGAASLALRRVGRPDTPEPDSRPRAPAPAPGFFRRAWLQAFEKDAADVARGLYPPMRDGRRGPRAAARAWSDLMRDAPEVAERRRRRGAVEVRAESPESRGLPPYYRQNFHFQSGGWLTHESARRYEAQVEALFAGAAGAMRRRALSLLATAWRGRDQRDLIIVDLACGSGAFLENLSVAFPRTRLVGIDLSAAYLNEARRHSGVAAVAQAQAERLPFADGAIDAINCIYLFHELPPAVRGKVAAEIARVLKPGGFLAFADSIQPRDEPQLEGLLEVFPAYFHEPFYKSYGAVDLHGLFAAAGLNVNSEDRAFLTKAILFERSGGPGQLNKSI